MKCVICHHALGPKRVGATCRDECQEQFEKLILLENDRNNEHCSLGYVFYGPKLKRANVTPRKGRPWTFLKEQAGGGPH
jgi:hypothetical protein